MVSAAFLSNCLTAASETGFDLIALASCFIADYVNHNILKVDMETREISVHAHAPTMNQPNDIAIGANDIIYASDPNWVRLHRTTLAD